MKIDKDYELVFGVRITEDRSIIKGYWVKTVVAKGEHPNVFFVEGDLTKVIEHIKRRNKLFDVDRAEAFLKAMEEATEEC